MTEIEAFDIGDKVKHPKFGTGTVMFRSGEGENQKLTVKFAAEVGEKKLLAKFANLKRISERPTLPAAEPTVVPGRARLADADEKYGVEEEVEEEEELEEDDAEEDLADEDEE